MSTTTIARHLTAGGATVEVYDAELTAVRDRVEVHNGAKFTAVRISATACCTGCGWKQTAQETEHPLSTNGPSVADWAVANAKRWAQGHAEKCRATPRS